MSKLVRGDENHPRTSKASGIKYKDENGKTLDYVQDIGKDCGIPADVAFMHVKARAFIQYNKDGYDMQIDDCTPRTYKPGNSDLQLNAQTSSHIVKTKDGYTKDVTYREPGRYNKTLGSSHEHIQIHPVDYKNNNWNLTEHSYSFENKDVKLSKLSLDAPTISNKDIPSKLNGEFMEINGKVLEATGPLSLSFEQKDNKLIRHNNPNVRQILEEIHNQTWNY